MSRRPRGDGDGRGPRGPVEDLDEVERDSAWVIGRHAVRELLERGRESAVEKVMVAEDLPAAVRGPLGELARAAGAILQAVPRRSLDAIAGGASHQGMAARTAPRPLLTLTELLSRLEGREEVLLVLLDRVEDPRNLGAIARSAAAAGADGLLVPERRSAGLSPAAAKAAAGALERIPIARVGSVAKALAILQEAGLHCVGLDAAGGSAWQARGMGGRLCLVVGAEDGGLSRLVRERCDELVSFPLAGGVESLNASVAASLALYEVLRRRQPAEAPG